jgi:hypothetical protein
MPIPKCFQPLTLAIASAVLAGCGGGGGGATAAPPTQTPATPTPTPVQSPQTFTATAQATSAPLPAVGSYGGTISIPSGSGSASVATALSNAAGTPVLQVAHGVSRRDAANNTPLLYITLTATTSVALSGVPGFSITVPSTVTGSVYLALLENGVWTTVSGPVLITNATATFAPSSGTLSIAAGQSAYFVVYEGGIVPTPGALSVSPTTLSILGLGTANNSTLTASEPNYSGAFTATPSSACSGVVSLSATTFTSSVVVTPLGAGACTITVADDHGGSTTVQTGVTTSSITGQ